MKRSTQISLVLISVAGVGAGSFALSTPRGSSAVNCGPAAPGVAVPTPSPQSDCTRGGFGSSGHMFGGGG